MQSPASDASSLTPLNPVFDKTKSAAEALIAKAESELSQTLWPKLDAQYYELTQRVMEAFQQHRVGEEHFYSVSGYGHDDLGRQAVDGVFASALQAESAMVRLQMVSGTHAIAVALRGVLQPADTLLTLTGPPYDTLEEVIGKRGDSPLALTAQGIKYIECDILENSQWAEDPSLQQEIKQAKVLYLQRSRGYSLRRTLTIAEIEAICTTVKALHPAAIIIVDNCYGEFTEGQEPTAVGANLIAGSLIKNPGGGIAPTGGYIAGRSDLVKACGDALTAPGIGNKGGFTFDLSRTLLQGIFLAPNTVKEAVKSMTLAAYVFETLGYRCYPRWNDWPRSDIIQAIELGSEAKLIQFCQTLQRFSPIASNITPIPAVVPGYADAVIMAGGTFIDGATLELSADGPLRTPYTVFFQGGLHYGHARAVIQQLIQAL